MKVRVFLPRTLGPADGTIFSASDHTFPMVPSVGHLVRFTDERAGEFTVAKVGFTQDGDAFMAAVWLEASGSEPVFYSEPIDEREDLAPDRDLNCDVPPESMTGY